MVVRMIMVPTVVVALGMARGVAQYGQRYWR